MKLIEQKNNNTNTDNQEDHDLLELTGECNCGGEGDDCACGGDS